MESPEIKTWQSELRKSSLRYHLIGCWVAIIVNPIWSIGDYLVIRDYWEIFLIIRITVTLLILACVHFKDKLGVETIIFIPFLAISLENAYMCSVMDISQFQKQTLAYVALFIGAGMLVLWKPIYSIIVVAISLSANIIFLHLFSPLTILEILPNGGLLTATVAVFTIILIETRYQLTKKEIISRLGLAESNIVLERQKKIIAEKNKDITDSLEYAKRIQQALLPSINELKIIFPESFIFFKPKDIVSGDFFWIAKNENDLFVAAADCTGHGVPGALMSVIGSSFLNEIVNEKKIVCPDEILFHLREKIIFTLRKKDEDTHSSKDGMDISLCRFVNYSNSKNGSMTVQFSGAFNPLWLIRKGDFIEYRGDKFPVGLFVNDSLPPFMLNEVQAEKGDMLFLFTDGFADQFGGTNDKKFKYTQLKKLLLSFGEKKAAERENILHETLKTWKGNNEQTDDILIIGIEV